MPQVMATVAETLAGLLLETIRTTEVSTIVTTVCGSVENSNSTDRSNILTAQQQQPQPQQQQQKESPEIVSQCHQRKEKEKEKLSTLILTSDQIDTKKSFVDELIVNESNKKEIAKITNNNINCNNNSNKDNFNFHRKVKLTTEEQVAIRQVVPAINSSSTAAINFDKAKVKEESKDDSSSAKICPSKSDSNNNLLHYSRENSPDPKCIKSTLESILNLIDSAPVTTSGCVKLIDSSIASPKSPESSSYSPARSIKSPSPSPSPKSPSISIASPSPVHICIDLNNNLLEPVDENQEESNESNHLTKYPQLVPLKSSSSHPTAVSDSESESESNTTIEEEPLTNPSSPNLVIDQETEPEVNCEIERSEQEVKEEGDDSSESEIEVESEEDEYEVERILKKRIERGTQRIFYLVKWKGYDFTECTWEPVDNLFKCQESIETFEKEERKRKRAAYRLKLNEKLSKKRRLN